MSTRWFDTSGRRRPYERTEQEVRDKTLDDMGLAVFTRVDCEENGNYVIHVGGMLPPHQWILDALHELLARQRTEWHRIGCDKVIGFDSSKTCSCQP